MFGGVLNMDFESIKYNIYKPGYKNKKPSNAIIIPNKSVILHVFILKFMIAVGATEILFYWSRKKGTFSSIFAKSTRRKKHAVLCF